MNLRKKIVMVTNPLMIIEGEADAIGQQLGRALARMHPFKKAFIKRLPQTGDQPLFEIATR